MSSYEYCIHVSLQNLWFRLIFLPKTVFFCLCITKFIRLTISLCLIFL